MDGRTPCPLLNKDRLCRIQAEIGEAFLPRTCADYPRIRHTIRGAEETALALSCPEAARLVLFNPMLETDCGPQASQPACYSSGESDIAGEETAPVEWFWPIRNSVLALIRNRAYPLWQRLFLVGVFCQKLDSIWKCDPRRSVPEWLEDFANGVAAGTMRPAMEALPTDSAAQLDVVLRLAGLMLHRLNVTERFAEMVQAFGAGIGNGAGATLESLSAGFDAAHDRYFAPFFKRHPYVLENYLINTVIRYQFPFGRDAMRSGETPSMTRESVMLTAQFALVKGLLIGVAGRYREGFSAEHVVHTAQAACKHFEHHPEFLQKAYELLVESRMDGMTGLAILSRNGMAAHGGPDAVPQDPAAGLGRWAGPEHVYITRPTQ
jgi:lysine-N-methylase